MSCRMKKLPSGARVARATIITGTGSGNFRGRRGFTTVRAGSSGRRWASCCKTAAPVACMSPESRDDPHLPKAGRCGAQTSTIRV